METGLGWRKLMTAVSDLASRTLMVEKARRWSGRASWSRCWLGEGLAYWPGRRQESPPAASTQCDPVRLVADKLYGGVPWGHDYSAH